MLFRAALWFAVAALVLLVPQVSRGDAGGAASVAETCSDWSVDRRFSVIREDVLSKLSALLPFNFSSGWQSGGRDGGQNDTGSLDPGLLAAYEALSQVVDDGEPTSCAARPERGRGTPPFAKRISLFFPTNSTATDAELFGTERETEDNNNSFSSDSTPPTQYIFSFKPVLPSQPIYSAELRLFKRIVSRCNDLFENVEVFYVRRDDGEERERVFVTSKNVELVTDEYTSFDVLEAVNKWIESGLNGSLELEVMVNCPFSISSGSYSPPSIEFIRDNSTTVDLDIDETRPQLVVATITEDVATELRRRKRKRRQAIDSGFCRNNPTAIHCCIRTLVVNFHTDLHLPWVLHPPTFTPNYCEGVCPVPFLGDNYLRLSIQQFYQTNDLGGGPCCTIYAMDSLLMMIRDPRTEEVVFADVPNMEITSCGCVD